MEEEQKTQKWWQTLPGILTATAAIITAVTGLIVALYQAGVFDTDAERASLAQNTASTARQAAMPSAGRATVPRATDSSSTGQIVSYPITLAAGTEVRLGSAVYKILAAHLEGYNVEKRTLRFTVRMTNNLGYPDNFWDSSFRLLVDGVPRAPIGGLNKLVEGHSAEEGDVVFVIPAATQSIVFEVRHEDESTEIPVNLLRSPS